MEKEQISGPDFRKTWLWRQAFLTPRSDSTTDEQEYFKAQYLAVRKHAEQLVSRIAADLPGLTVHDISHLDALWETASVVSEGAVNVNPAEAFVLGVSILLHDAAMSLAAYPGGINEVKGTLAWKDAIARRALAVSEGGGEKIDIDNPSIEIVQSVAPEVLRRLHAERAEVLAEQAWTAHDGSQIYLIEDSELRRFYGPTIGKIAHSHWWSVQRIENEFPNDLGALASKTNNKVDRVKLACLLRIADALHLDSRRAPRFLRTITNPSGISALHWAFQERLARPHVELDSAVFTTGQPFGKEDAEAWWLAYDTLNSVDRELKDVDLLLRDRGREVLKARAVKGAGSPEVLAKLVETKGWRPVDAKLQVSDVPRIVENLGGSKLYGNDPTVALRELIQNAADAVQARRKIETRKSDWGRITVGLRADNGKYWLCVEDNGIGMSEQVLTGPLLDFGTSFWRSPLALDEFPGLMAAGMHAIGRFGIGFFSVFMLGPIVRVYSRRYDRGKETGRLLEFRGGTSSRPILSPCIDQSLPVDGGTRVEVLLKTDPFQAGGLLYSPNNRAIPMAALVASIAPNLDVGIEVVDQSGTQSVASPGDWLRISDLDLVTRLNPHRSETDSSKAERALMQLIEDENGKVFGRAYIAPARYSYLSDGGWVTISGLRASRISNIQGILLGEATNAARDASLPLVTNKALAAWASNQAGLIAESIKDEERQARSAEVILECGGSIGELKIIRVGSSWLSSKEFKEHLGSCREIAINFRGEFEYDEDDDRVHPKDFRDNFERMSGVAIVLKHDGSVLKSGPSSWPRVLTGAGKSDQSNIGDYVVALINETWAGTICEDFEYVVIGTVNGVQITRLMTVYRLEDPIALH